MKRMTAALSALLILSGPAFAAPSDPGPATATERPALATPAPTDARPMPPRGQRPPGAERGMQLAARLAAAETLIGIKSAQLDAWRGYTSALIDLVQPPAPPPPPPPSGDAAAGRAFARQEEMARRIKERAAKADTLLAAIATLRETLTEAQLAALGRIDLVPRPPMPPFPGGPGPMGDHGPGHPPREGGPMIAGPMGDRDAPPPPHGDAPDGAPAMPDEPDMAPPPAP